MDMKYKVVRRGPRYCVRVNDKINSNDSYHWCRQRNMSYHVKYHGKRNKWIFDFIFDKEYEATAFILGFLGD
jgi:hypothetical protein